MLLESLARMALVTVNIPLFGRTIDSTSQNNIGTTAKTEMLAGGWGNNKLSIYIYLCNISNIIIICYVI